MEYIEVIARYEHNKNLLSVISITLVISILFDIWRFVYDIISKILFIDNEFITNKDTAILTLISIVFLLSIVILLIILSLLKGLKKLSKEKMLLDEVKAMRNIKK